VSSTRSKYVGGQLNFYDGALNPAAPTGLWANCPILAIQADPSLGSIFVEDFMSAPIDANHVGRLLEVDDSTTGTNVSLESDTLTGGWGSIVTAGADNDYHAISSTSENWVFLDGKKLWFEARFIVTEAATSQSAWWVGLTDTLTTGGFQADAAGPLASYDGALIWKDEDTLIVDFETSNAGTQVTKTAEATVVSGTIVKVGFYFDGASTTSNVTPYYNVAGTNAWTKGTPATILLSGLQAMHMVAGIKSKGSVETISMNKITIVQLY
jgi:hypothetical protein